MTTDPSTRWPLELPRSGHDPISFAVGPLDRTLFREYDVRGRTDPHAPDPSFPLNEFVANQLGRAFGTFLARHDHVDVAVGHDSRSYSEKLATALMLGLLSTGRNVHFIGLAPTPLVYFAQHHLGGMAGVEVTASHNPNGWAGFKLADRPSITLGPDEIVELRDIADSRDFATGRGTYSEHIVLPAYIDDLVARVPRTARAVRVVVDGGNSISGPVVEQVLRAAGHDVIAINLELDWTFPNHEPDPETMAARQQIGEAVVAHGAAVGLSLDGDGDRLGVTDEKGAIVWSDLLLALLARDSLSRHPGSPIVYDVKCSRAVSDVISSSGGIPVMWKTGHSHIKSKAREVGASYSGERSGHFFDAGDYYGFDDAAYAALRFVQIVGSAGQAVSDLVAELPKYSSTPTMHAHCEDRVKYDVVARLVESVAAWDESPEIFDVNGIRAEFDDGWFLVRASSNLPALVIVVEATSDARLRELYDAVRGELAAMPEVDREWNGDPFAAAQIS